MPSVTAQMILVVLLVAAPVAAGVVFAIGGLLQVRRRDRLARAAHEAGLLFSAEDPFDVPRRYARFALVGGGHSGRAMHVTYGRLGGLPVRAFDFRYEIGHGTRRQGRHYAVVAVEGIESVRAMLLWRQRDLDLAPLAVRGASQRLGDWVALGEAAAGAVAALPQGLAETVTGLETLGSGDVGAVGAGSGQTDAAGVLLVWAPVRRGRLYAIGLAEAVALAAALTGRGGGGQASDPTSPAGPEC
jgi:hypothetical protein